MKFEPKNATKATFFCVFFIKNMTKISKLYFAKVEGLLKTPGLHDVQNALFSSKRGFSDQMIDVVDHSAVVDLSAVVDRFEIAFIR